MTPVIHIYESRTAPPMRRFIAQFDVVKKNHHITIAAPTREIATACARLHLEFQAVPVLRRKEFNLAGKLAALFQSEVDDMEDLL